MKKRLTAILLALVLMMGLTTFAAAEEGIPTAATFDELVAAMENGATTVEITGTISVTGNLGNNDVTITLTRSADFADGALLQIEQGEIKNLIVSGADIDTESPLAIISGSCLISNTAFTNCTDSAVVITTGTAMFENCSFEDNSGTHITNDAEAVFTKCSFSDGQSKDNGGAILYNLMSAESQKHYASNENIFIDVKDDTAIAALAKAKIVLGYDEHYRPDAYLTRGELCAILSRFSDLKSGASSFQNIEHHWARDYVNICVSNGWIADGTEIDLNSYITVKVAANIIEKML